MAVRLILQYTAPSQALTVCEPWTRLLVEVERPNEEGHVIGDVLRLRKLQQEAGSIKITGSEVQQLQENPATARRYLAACAWWLRHRPFGVEQLPVRVVAHAYADALVHMPDWRVASLDLCYAPSRAVRTLTDLRRLRSLLPAVEELRVANSSPAHILGSKLLRTCAKLRRLCLAGTDFSLVPLIPLHHLVSLDLHGCRSVTDIGPLSSARALQEVNLGGTGVSDFGPLARCTALRVLDISQCTVVDLSFLENARSLRKLNVSRTPVSSLAVLSTCLELRALDASKCGDVEDWTPLSVVTELEVVNVSFSSLSSVSFLAELSKLREVNVRSCRNLEDLSPLAGAESLEVLNASYSGVRDITGLGSCPNLRDVNFCGCQQLQTLSPLAGAASLQAVSASHSCVRDITGLGSCPNLRDVNFCGCQQLLTLSPLAGAASLQTVDASLSRVWDITGLGSCPKLRDVDFSFCQEMKTLLPLAGALKLETIDARRNHPPTSPTSIQASDAADDETAVQPQTKRRKPEPTLETHPYQCARCQRLYMSWHGLRTHIEKQRHGFENGRYYKNGPDAPPRVLKMTPPRFRCTLCPRQFAHHHTLAYHMIDVHQIGETTQAVPWFRNLPIVETACHLLECPALQALREKHDLHKVKGENLHRSPELARFLCELFRFPDPISSTEKSAESTQQVIDDESHGKNKNKDEQDVDVTGSSALTNVSVIHQPDPPPGEIVLEVTTGEIANAAACFSVNYLDPSLFIL